MKPTAWAGSARGMLNAQVDHLVRRLRAGSVRCVNEPPPSGIGPGNLLYFWLWAHAGRRYGLDWWVRATPAMGEWQGRFPALAELTITPAALSVLDRRVTDWAQAWGKFSPDIIDSFVRERLASAPQFRDGVRQRPDGEVTINVRRGDYYSVPQHRSVYGFDVVDYVRRAVDGSAAQDTVTRLRVVSDDPAWCAQHLAFLADVAPCSFSTTSDTPWDNLLALASAPRLVLANSTFSYWGAHLSGQLNDTDRSMIWAPDFHARSIDGGAAYQLDPRWSVVRTGEVG